MVKATAFRGRSVGTKVTEEEYAQLVALAGGRSLSEWVREILLQAEERSRARVADERLMAEVLALRTILLNVLFKLSNGEKITAQEMQQLINRADADKLKKAAERLSGAQAPS